MPRRTRDHYTPSSLSREQSLPRKEPSGRSCAQAAHPPLTTVWGACGQPFPHQRPRRRVDLKRPSRPAASAPPSRSWPSSRDEESFFIATRRDKTAKAYLPASNTLSSLRSVTPTPQGLVCRKVQHNFSSVWQLGDALGLPPLPSVLLPPADHVLGDTIGSLLQRTDTVPAIFQSSASLSIIPKKDGTRGMDRRVPYLAHKLPGTHSCLPGFDAFSPRSWEASYIVRTDNMAVKSHINHQGGSRSRTLDRLARRLLLWSQDKFLSLRAVHVPGILNLAADFLTRQKLRPGEWMLNRQTVTQIWNLFGEAEVDLFASQESSQCPLWFSPSFQTTPGIDTFTHLWPNVSLYAFPPGKLIPAVLCRVKVSSARLLLIAPFWPSQTWFSELTPLLYRPPWEIPNRRDLLSQLQGRIWHPQPEIWKLWVWPIRGQGPWWIICLSRFRRPSPVPGPPLLGSCTLPSGVSLSPGVLLVQ